MTRLELAQRELRANSRRYELGLISGDHWLFGIRSILRKYGYA